MNRSLIKIVAFCIICHLFSSCGNNQIAKDNEIYVTHYNDSIKIIDSPNKPLPLLKQRPYLSFGKIEQVTFSDSMKVEQNLISQITAFNSALVHGDEDTYMSYMYMDAIKYCKKYYPGLSDEELFDQSVKSTFGQLKDMIEELDQKGIEATFVVPNLIRKVQCGNDIIIVFNITANYCSEYVYTYSNEMEHNIGVSQNGGVNWCFFTENEDMPTILKMRYNQDIVNKVMGYSY